MINPSAAQTSEAVGEHYDELDRFYREVWGEHVHHGYWATGREKPEEAVNALVELVADRLALSPGQHVCDIGCGYGATAQVLAERYGVRVTGVTISREQAERAEARARSDPALSFERRDWLENRFEDAAFDRALSIESSEHMEDKQRFFAEAFRTLRPGGRLVVCAWLACEAPSAWQVRYLLEPICREGRLPSMGSESDYRDLAKTAGFRVIGFEDLSAEVSRTWRICARRLTRKLASDPAYRRFLLDPRAKNRIFALTLARLILGYRTGAMRYGLITAEKVV